MDWLKRMEDALEFIESKMNEPLDIEAIAKVAYSSPFHFQRMFYMLTGMTVGEYVRKRKLTLAAQELAVSSAKVVDVALKYGYNSPESFAKLFRKIHGISPSEARNSGVSLKAFPRISFQLTIRGEKEVEYIIEEKEAFNVVGKSATLTCGSKGRTRQWFWRECQRDGTLAKIDYEETDTPLLGITLNFNDNFTYMIGKKKETAVPTAGLTLQKIPSSSWAVFPCTGPLPEAIQNGFRQIYQEWFPATEYEHAGLPEIEVYTPGKSEAEGYRSEVWIPVMKR
ncbi:AraC family transcriptional regulator [Bacillus litorisediminis]|uniref:AraC family transcriptional regulator n=1 Tax=Bacillus litorisediminis TaxID=2922713 RepID=UPI001FAF733F|nr:AraC family transcriptional regulator [Bacillus litorisediminis]